MGKFFCSPKSFLIFGGSSTRFLINGLFIKMGELKIFNKYTLFYISAHY